MKKIIVLCLALLYALTVLNACTTLLRVPALKIRIFMAVLSDGQNKAVFRRYV